MSDEAQPASSPEDTSARKPSAAGAGSEGDSSAALPSEGALEPAPEPIADVPAEQASDVPDPAAPPACEAEPASTDEPSQLATPEAAAGAAGAPEPAAPAEPEEDARAEGVPAEPESDSEPKPAPAGRRWLKVVGGVLIASLLFVLLLPTILSQGILSALLRSQAGAELGRSEVSWTGGLRLEALDREHNAASPEDMGYAFWCQEMVVETSLVGSAWAGVTGGDVEAKVVLRGAGMRLELGEGSAPPEDPAATPAPSESPPPAEGEGGLACGAKVELVLDGFDVHVRQGGGPLVILEGLSGSGSLEVAKDGSFQLTTPLALELTSLRVPMGSVEQPWDGRLDIRGASLLVKRLVLPIKGDPIVEAEITSPSLHVYGLEFRDARLTAKSEGPEVVLGLTGNHPGADGTLAFASRVNRSNATRWPVSLDLDLRELPVRGVMGDLVPILLPMVHSVNNRAGRFPPISLHSRGQFELVFSEEGIEGQQTLDSLKAKGKVALAPGKLQSSLLMRGYVNALTQLEVGSVLGAFLPADWEFEGGESPFDVVGERFKLHSFPLRTKVLDLTLGAEVGMVSGDYDAKVKGRGRGKLPKQAEGVLGSIDRAGGIGLRGNLWEFGEPAVVLPAKKVLLEAIKAEGAGGAWLERGGPLLEGVGEGLKLPR